jgi:hypothetical protein
MTTADDLRAVRDTLASPNDWRKGALVSANGDESGVTRCWLGARFHGNATLEDLRKFDYHEGCEWYDEWEETTETREGLEANDAACAAMAKVIREHYPLLAGAGISVGDVIMRFNDIRKTTHEDVLAMTEKAIVEVDGTL